LPAPAQWSPAHSKLVKFRRDGGRHFVQAPSMPREETDVVVVLLKTGA